MPKTLAQHATAHPAGPRPAGRDLRLPSEVIADDGSAAPEKRTDGGTLALDTVPPDRRADRRIVGGAEAYAVTIGAKLAIPIPRLHERLGSIAAGCRFGTIPAGATTAPDPSGRTPATVRIQ